ncbi:MAG: hypothetical protein KGM42_01995 [Hyphomicrobiales bacterium]|nr:hypothetical protein [Hyphomicrobiales bacterium]
MISNIGADIEYYGVRRNEFLKVFQPVRIEKFAVRQGTLNQVFVIGDLEMKFSVSVLDSRDQFQSPAERRIGVTVIKVFEFTCKGISSRRSASIPTRERAA